MAVQSATHVFRTVHALFEPIWQAFRQPHCRPYTALNGLAIALQSSDSAAREQLEKVVEVLDSERCTTFDECIAWARRRFQVRPSQYIPQPWRMPLLRTRHVS